MDTTTIFLFFVFACVGAGVGGLIQRSLDARKARAAPPLPESSLTGEGDTEILRAWRTKAGKVWLEMDQTRLDDKGALQVDQRRRLLNLVVDLRPWLETAPEPTPGRELQTRPASPTTPTGRVSAAPTAPAGVKADDAKPQISMKSIVQQIDDVLQTKLAGTVFEPKDIHIMESPGGGVAVQIGREKYEGVDAVPEAEIRALIRQAVADWEKSAK